MTFVSIYIYIFIRNKKSHNMTQLQHKYNYSSSSTLTHSKNELTDKQQSQEQKHGQQYFLDVRPHKLFSDEIYLVTK